MTFLFFPPPAARASWTSATDASGNKTDYAYNVADQVITVQQPATGDTGAGRVTTNAYQYPGGSLTSVTLTDESGAAARQVNYTYTAEGEVASVSGSTQPVSYAYDGAGRATRLTDGNAHNTYYLYNPRGDLLQMQYPGSGGGGVIPLSAGTIDTLTNITFDDEQSVLTAKDGRGVLTTYTRPAPDSLVTALAYSNLPAGVTAIPDIAYTYDLWGRLSGLNDGVTGSAAIPKTFTYDDLDNPLSITTNFVGGPQGQTLSYSYKNDGSRFQMGTPAGTYGYEYDGLGRITKALFPWTGGSVTHVYFPNGWLNTSKTSRFLTTYGYNARGLVNALTNKNTVTSATVSDFTGYPSGLMKYDAAGNRLGLTAGISAQGSAPSANRSQTFVYDTNYPGSPNLSRDVLLNETSTATANAYNQQYVWNFGYDSAYNANTMRSAAIAHNVDNQRTTAGNLGGFNYDGNGNPTQYNSPTAGNFSFDVLNRLSAITTPAFSASYDAGGLRARKTAGGATLWFLYDEAGNATTPLIEETFSGGTTTVVGATGMGADGVRMRYYPARVNLKIWSYAFDPQGNLAERVNNEDNGSPFFENVYATAVFDGYGKGKEIQASNGASPPLLQHPVGFGGQFGYYTDFETGLLCLTHRYYDPATGRFVNRDPIGYEKKKAKKAGGDTPHPLVAFRLRVSERRRVADRICWPPL